MCAWAGGRAESIWRRYVDEPEAGCIQDDYFTGSRGIVRRNQGVVRSVYGDSLLRSVSLVSEDPRVLDKRVHACSTNDCAVIEDLNERRAGPGVGFPMAYADVCVRIPAGP